MGFVHLRTTCFLFFFSNFINTFVSPTRHLCLPDQREALMEFKSEFEIDSFCQSNAYPKTKLWANNSDCCSWNGITCNPNSGQVMELDLSSSCLYGTLNSKSSLYKLKKLRVLNLAYNDFNSSMLRNGNNSLVSLDLTSTSLSGNIPDSINNLKHLTTLILKSCKLYGTIPSSLGNLSSLSYLDLSKNDFNGHIPSSIRNLTHLTNLDLSFNRFDGEIPSFIASLKQLTSLDVCSNTLSGNFPLPLLNRTKLSYLNISYNQFTGTLPPNMSSLSSLEYFDAKQNSFFGTIPFTLFTIPSLGLLDLRDNQFNGMSSPSHLKTRFSGLSEVYLSNNRIRGQVPGWIWSLPYLTILLLSNNSFSGFEVFTKDFSGEIFWLLDLRSNDFQGPLFVPPRPTRFLLASKNHFTGEIPISLCDIAHLQILDIANNNLNGSVPGCFQKLMEAAPSVLDFPFNSSLSVLDLGGNHFTGSLPDIFTNASNLRSLNVGHNHFTGILPRSLIGCSSLEVLNVEHNTLNDTFPVWLQPLKTLRVMILRSNEFHGSLLNRGPSWFPQLRIIDISHNDFMGTIPSDFFMYWRAMSSKGDLPKLKYLGDNTYYHDSMDLMNKGVNLEYTRIFTLLTTIDFSRNRLHGKIPESIGLLKDLIVLNLSSNGFSSNIPSSLANLTELESLDLSHNKLSGQIPPPLRDLTRLSFIRVSHNELVGPIPESTQFQTQSGSSFEENLGLCGPPLEENCGGTQQPETEEEEEEEEGEQVLSWIAAAIGVAPGLIFGFTIGHTVITHKQKKRRASR